MAAHVLLGFSVRNYRSLRDQQTISMVRRTKDGSTEFVNSDVVPALAIMGPNASGKSNLLRALQTMFAMIRNSASHVDSPLPFDPFRLGDSIEPTTTFEVAVRFGEIRFDYEFTFDAARIHHERLLSWPKGRQRVLFERRTDEPDPWYFGDSLTGSNQALAKATRDDALFLSTAKLLNHEVLAPIQQDLVTLIRSVGVEDSRGLLERTLESIQKEPALLNRVAGLLARADLGVVALEIQEDEQAKLIRESAQRLFDSIPQSSDQGIQFKLDSGVSTLVPSLRHSGSRGGVILPFSAESVGTKNFIGLLGPVLESLATGGVLVIDEIDTSLHSRLVNELVRLFQSPASNPNQAQLLLSTHDVTVIMNTGDYDVLDRDQIWFVEKDPDGSSAVYPLTQFKARAGEVFSRYYLMDRYGAIPGIDRHSFIEFLGSETDQSEPS